MEGALYRPIAEKAGGSLFTIFVASLGLTIAGENLIRLVWGSAGRAVDGPDVHRIGVGSATITGLDLTAALVAWVLILALWAVLRFTRVGKLITAVRVNPAAARVFGISPERIYLLVLFVGTVLGGVVALHAALKLAATPDMGLAPLVSAFLVVFLGGYNRSPAVLGLTGLLIGLIESLSALWLPPIWAPIVLFGVLLLYIVVKSFDVLRALPRRLSFARGA
jgi:branched-subunit amino acid ABC-type transport system permease component